MSNKMPLQWHKDCLKNFRAGTERKVAEAARIKEEADRMLDELKFRESQIAAAEAAGKDGYDADRFMRKVAK